MCPVFSRASQRESICLLPLMQNIVIKENIYKKEICIRTDIFKYTYQSLCRNSCSNLPNKNISKKVIPHSYCQYLLKLHCNVIYIFNLLCDSTENRTAKTIYYSKFCNNFIMHVTKCQQRNTLKIISVLISTFIVRFLSLILKSIKLSS